MNGRLIEPGKQGYEPGEHLNGLAGFAQEGKCPDTEVLAAYLDQRLSADEARRVEAHLAQCDGCLDTLLAVHHALEESAENSCLDQRRLQEAMELVPGTPHLFDGICRRIESFLHELFVPAPVFAVLLIAACSMGFYAGMYAGIDRQICQRVVSAELHFFFDEMPTVLDDLPTGGG